MIDPKEFLAAGQLLHGHKCPAMPLGLRAGAAALNALGVERAKDKELLAILDLGEGHFAHCFADGVQMITGCTFGKGNIRASGHGKFALTLVDKAGSRAVRVAARTERLQETKKTEFFREYRMKGIPASQVPEEVVSPLVEKVMNAPEEKLLKVGQVFRYEVEPKAGVFDSLVCDRCGEMVVEPYARVVGDKRVCIPCADELRLEK